MKKITAILCALCYLVLCACSAPAASPVGTAPAGADPSPQAKGDLKVLFIGNSFTFYNEMPTALFQKIAEGQGHTLTVTAITTGSQTLQVFADSQQPDGQRVLEALAADDYAYVILQEQSTRPYKLPAQFYDAVGDFCDLLKPSGASILLYQTWGYDGANPTLASEGETTESQTLKLAAAYQAIAAELNLAVSPVGTAFYSVYQSHPEIQLYNAEDLKHPSLAGSYLAALCHCACIYGEDPTAVTFIPEGISAQDAAVLQAAARDTVADPAPVPAEYRVSSVGVTAR